MVEDWQRAGFGLYVHWPFCEAKCPYCDFNSHVVRHVDQKPWVDAFRLEMDRAFARTGKRPLNSIFFGGGTPSLMAAETVEAVISHAHKLWGFANDIEITLEANPSSVEAKKFADFRLSGVNRVSLGVQALNDHDLKLLGRLHSSSEALKAIEVAQAEFQRVSFDLIYGRQNQSLSAWEVELNQAIGLGTNHLSLYHLTIEPETAFGDRYERGRLRGLPDEDLSVSLFEATQDITKQNGFSAYEVSNHAKNDEISDHNMIYWSYGDYVGIGPGAHGRVTVNGQKFSTETPLQPGRWLKDALEDQKGATSWATVAPREQAIEMTIMGLRTDRGVAISDLVSRSQDTIDETGVAEMLDAGYLDRSENRLVATASGRLVLNSVIEKVIKSDT